MKKKIFDFVSDDKEKRIFIVTPGEVEKGENPKMTEKGVLEVVKLKNLLPQKPAMVICGAAKRYVDVVIALGFDQFFLKDPRFIVGENYVENPGTDVMEKISKLPDNTVICGGRSLMNALGHPHATFAAVYEMTFLIIESVHLREMCVDEER